jgi:hypothetical protein
MKNYLVLCVIAVAVFGCNSEKRSYGESSDTISKSLTGQDSLLTEKIIKVADMKFRVKDVQNTKEAVSKTIEAEGGSVVEFSMNSVVQETEKVKYSADSLMELTSYRTEGFMIARVPSNKLDEFTNKMAKLAVFIDSQSMKVEDQSVMYLANKLKNQNKVEAVDQLNKHATKKSNNVETALHLKDDYVDHKIANLLIDQQVQYSTITLSFYQDNTVKQMIVSNDHLYDYKPDFFKRLVLSFVSGWVVFKELLLFIISIWVWIAISLAGYAVFRHYRKKQILVP